MGQNNDYGAYMNPDLMIRPTSRGILNGTTFAVKDVIAIRGHVSSAGNPAWLRSHQPAEEHAEAVRRLLAAGAELRGVTHTDELMYSLGGENIHYGTPINPRARGRIPGGSSSGSAVAVASNSVDFALGTDTGGSVRVPASYCGIYGFRPSHGAVDMRGVIPLAPRFDTIGWMARSPELLLRVGEVLLASAKAAEAEDAGRSVPRLLLAKEAWALTDPSCGDRWSEALRSLQAGATATVEIGVAEEGLEAWKEAFRELQASQIWAAHGAWIRGENPAFGPDIADRFTIAEQMAGQDHSRVEVLQRSIVRRLYDLLGDDGVLVIPTVPGVAPFSGGRGEELERNRSGALTLCCIAGLAGLPQVTLPVNGPEGLPLGLSVIGGPGRDLRLLAWINHVWKTVRIS
ncbi:MAG: amidase [Paenibacillaceae bacterium]|uniref:Amidase n=1 Tax=Paenibacillus mellifer TaxID=2937794 RepID=A0A9X1Y2J9_9BACL|nr:amidase [Paenibacillus mellifer]MBW4840013.1 amidase [Paenibacillaceae bacterium]MCK8486262.1 amidase [Paenibacillus mellifer]